LQGTTLVIEAFTVPGFHRGHLDRPGVLRLELIVSSPLTEGEWLGDCATLSSEQGTLNIAAVGRGLVLSADGISLQRILVTHPCPGAATARITQDGLLQLWWAEEYEHLHLVTKCPEGLWEECEGTWMWGVPEGSSRFAVTLGTQRDGGISYPSAMELLQMNLHPVFGRSRNWTERSSKLSWNGRDFSVLDNLWTEHRLALYEPSWKIPNCWEGVGRGYGSLYYGHWDMTQNILDRVWNELEFCQGEIENLSGLFVQKEGRFNCGVRFEDPRRPVTTVPPPLEPRAVLEVYFRDGNLDRLRRCFGMFESDFAWFRKERRHLGSGLYWWVHMFETGYDNIGRAGTTVTGNTDFREYGAVDLSSQLALYAENLSRIARILGDEEKALRYEAARSVIVKAIQENLWDSQKKFFGDLHVPSNCLETTYAVSGFWPLAAGAATESQAANLVKHLTDPELFWTPFPVSTVAVKEAGFDLDCWRGPVWVSQNLWLVLGLRRYGYLQEAAQLVIKTLEGMQKVWDRDRKIYEFYHPQEFFPDKLTRKGKDYGPVVYYTGHNPLHAIVFHGLWGIEPCVGGFVWRPPQALFSLSGSVRFHWGDELMELASDGKGTVTCNGTDLIAGQRLIAAPR